MSTPSVAFDTLLMDLDGTLLGNRQIPLSIDFVKRSLAALTPHGGWRKAVSTLLAINREIRQATYQATNADRVVRLFSERMGMPEDKSRAFLRETLAVQFPELKKHFYPIPGSREFLDWAKDHYELYLATNPIWPQEIVELRVRWAGIDPALFRSMTHARRMHAAKPSPHYYEELLAQEKLDPTRCLLVGDDVKMDLPATQVGIPVFIVGDPSKNPRMKRLRPKGAQAPAWQGHYGHLRAWLTGDSSILNS